jgi:DNA-binding CsgD family transcriptional regulator
VFITLVVLPNIVIRSLGPQFWLNSIPARIIMALDSGLFVPLTFGLFYIALFAGREQAGENRAGPFGSFLFVLGWTFALAARLFTRPLLERAGLAADPAQGMSAVFALMKYLAAAIGFCAALCAALLRREARLPPPDARSGLNPQTDWPYILRLWGMFSCFTGLNSLMELRLFPFLTVRASEYRPLIIVAILTIPGISLLVGRRPDRYFRSFLLASIPVFITIPCVLFFGDFPRFSLVLSTLIFVFQYTAQALYTTAVVEHYRGRFWIYGCAASVHFTGVFSFLGPILGGFTPTHPGILIFTASVFSACFVLLTIKALFPKTPPARKSGAEAALSPGQERSIQERPIAEIFREHGLTGREMEVAQLMVAEGLDNAAISVRICRSAATVAFHATNIYRKFKVNGRLEFMALFVRR